LPKDKSWPPEIDIMEMLGNETTKFYTTLHTKTGEVKTKSDIPAHVVPDLSAGFNTYAADWGPDEIIFYFNDREIARRPTPPDMHKDKYILINLAVGGEWPGSPTAQTPFPAAMEIDWVRAYQRDAYKQQ
jgi:beta-glucanase (GH16 family)